MQRRSARILLSVAAVVAATTTAVVITAAASPSSPGASALAPITPCRLLDTRPGTDTVGLRSTALGAGETMTVDTWGTNGNCTIPTGATALSMNVVAITPTASSYLTVFPADATRPSASSLNWVANQAPTPNGVTARLAADGKLSFYNLAGTVHLAVDVVGYYEPVGAGATGPAGPTGPQGPGVDPQGVIWVAKNGGDFTSVSAALASITDNSINNRYVIEVAPGRYVENSGLQLKSYVDIEGAGAATVIESSGSNADEAAVIASGVDGVAVSDLTVSSTASNGVTIVNSTVSLTNVSVVVSSSSVVTRAVRSDNSILVVKGSAFRAEGATSDNLGLNLVGSGSADIDDSSVVVDGAMGPGAYCTALLSNGPDVAARDVDLTATSCATRNTALGRGTGTYEQVGGELMATGAGASNYGVFADTGFSRLDGVRIIATGPFSTGVWVDAASVTVVRSFIDTDDESVVRYIFGSARVWDSQLNDPTFNLSGGCVDVIDANFAPYTCA